VWERNRRVSRERDAERYAISLLDGVGGDREWWTYSPGLVGQLRVAVTAEEFEQVPPGCVTTDAGDVGPERARTRLT
jgi:hypothetical protein